MIERKIRVRMMLDFPLPVFQGYVDSGTFNRADSVESLRAKRAMHAHLTDPSVNFVTGFSPFSSYNPMPDPLPGESVIPRVLGLITETGDCFSILMRIQSGTTMCRVVAVEPGQTFDNAAALQFFNV